MLASARPYPSARGVFAECALPVARTFTRHTSTRRGVGHPGGIGPLRWRGDRWATGGSPDATTFGVIDASSPVVTLVDPFNPTTYRARSTVTRELAANGGWDGHADARFEWQARISACSTALPFGRSRAKIVSQQEAAGDHDCDAEVQPKYCAGHREHGSEGNREPDGTTDQLGARESVNPR